MRVSDVEVMEEEATLIGAPSGAGYNNNGLWIKSMIQRFQYVCTS